VQADPGKNYFELFGLPVRFDIDSADLTSRYRELQRRFHPDRFAASTPAERRLAMQTTAEINAGYQTLRDTVARGRYLLGLLGVSIDAETDTRMDPAFLMEQMELRETLDETRHATDRAARLAGLRGRVEQKIAEKTAALRAHFAENTGVARSRARHVVRELQFLQKLESEIGELE
jgi:molecular chaperone HscB